MVYLFLPSEEGTRVYVHVNLSFTKAFLSFTKSVVREVACEMEWLDVATKTYHRQ